MTGIPRELDLGQLLTEQAFVRRLAHSLLYDHADAEDAAQQSWLAALQQPPRDAARARPFLARIVRRAANNLRRSQRRRTAHESAVPPAEPEASVADALARESLRQSVVQELTALPEPYRSTLVLRFFDDLSPLEIARRLRVPDGTVRARSAAGSRCCASGSISATAATAPPGARRSRRRFAGNLPACSLRPSGSSEQP
jgi:RNA polymerase sigma factor (sigma-70 family)